MNTIEVSIGNNPESRLDQHASTGPHGGTVFFQIVRYDWLWELHP